MHLVIHDVPDLPKVDWVDDLIVSVFFITIQILSLTAVAGVVEKERVIWSCILHKPMHCPDDICFCRMAHGILLIIRQSDHVLSLVSKMLVQVG